MYQVLNEKSSKALKKAYRKKIDFRIIFSQDLDDNIKL